MLKAEKLNNSNCERIDLKSLVPHSDVKQTEILQLRDGTQQTRILSRTAPISRLLGKESWNNHKCV